MVDRISGNEADGLSWLNTFLTQTCCGAAGLTVEFIIADRAGTNGQCWPLRGVASHLPDFLAEGYNRIFRHWNSP